MNFKSVITQNWITRKVSPQARLSALASVFLLLFGTFIFLNSVWDANLWMAASGDKVFHQQEYWRLWTSLFAHADVEHVSGNLLLFIPFAYYLSGYFGVFFFPLVGFFMGGVTNIFVLKLLPDQVSLIGASGVVHWMGAAWMTLAFLIDRRESKGKRFLKGAAISMILFLPQVYRPEVSYAAHGIGYALGIISGIFFYYIYQNKFSKAEVIEYIPQEEVDFDWQENPESSAIHSQNDSSPHL